MCEKALPPKEMDMTKSHVHFFCQAASIRIFYSQNFSKLRYQLCGRIIWFSKYPLDCVSVHQVWFLYIEYKFFTC